MEMLLKQNPRALQRSLQKGRENLPDHRRKAGRRHAIREPTPPWAYRSSSKGPEGNKSSSTCPGHNLLNSSQLLPPDATGTLTDLVSTPAEAQVCSSGFVETPLDSPTAASLLKRSNGRVPSTSSICPDGRGRLKFGLQYVENLQELWVFIERCQGLRVGGGKRGKPNPYVMGFLLPWDLRIRKTAVQKATRDPVFQEQLLFPAEKALLKTKRLNLSVWHQVPFEPNRFLGQVNVDLEKWNFDNGCMLCLSSPGSRLCSLYFAGAVNVATSFLMHKKIWFDKFKYDDAERRSYEQRNGPVCSPSCPQSGTSTSSAGPSGDPNEPVARIACLEMENLNLRNVVTDLQLAICRLETRLSMLGRTSTSHRPSQMPPPPQHVTPMKKFDPLPTPSRKMELPGSSLAQQAEPSTAAKEDDGIDLFGSDDKEEDREVARVREERLRQYSEKKSKKPGLIAKSSILLDVKRWVDETDTPKMEEWVQTIQMDGLVWGASKLVPVGYGIKKRQIQLVVEDDKVGTDRLGEEITKLKDSVQSVDIAAFNKIQQQTLITLSEA
uniref:uncharacterized protein LOC130493998 n=1 Tax=Euleptes europaea TaxID=460621 RepID=UPI002541DA3B|nr:uncharacterized protein LOC130493998 [Euleptes europaea]